MSLVAQILGKARKVQILQDDQTVLQIDCTTSETHGRTVKPTNFEVEDGTSISDHLILSNFSLSLEGIISDSPISVLASALATGVGAVTPSVAVLPAAGLISAGAGSLFSTVMNSDSPSVKAYEKLLALQAKRKALVVITSLKRYDKMFLTELSAPRDSGTGQILKFTAKFEQLRIVQPMSVNVKLYSNADLAAEGLNQGTKEGESALLKEVQRGISVTRPLASALGVGN